MTSKYTLDEDQQLALAIAASLEEMEVVKRPRSNTRVSPAEAARRAVNMEPADEFKGCVVCATKQLLLYPPCLHPICGGCADSWKRTSGPGATCPICRIPMGRLAPVSGSSSATRAPVAPVQRCQAGGARMARKAGGAGARRTHSSSDSDDSESDSGSASNSSDCSDFYFLDSDSEVEHITPAPKSKAKAPAKPKTKKARVTRTPGEPVHVRGYYVEPHVRAAPNRKPK